MKPCPFCAQSIQDNALTCPACGRDLGGMAAGNVAAAAPAPAYAGPASSGKATASLVLGIFGFLFGLFLVGFPLAVLAIIFGHLSLSEMNKSAGRLTGRGKAIAGLVMGYTAVALLPILIIAAIAIPNLLHSRMAANESMSVSSVRTIVTATINYQAQCQKYPDTLAQLGPSAQNDCEHGLDYIDGVLASGQKSGYEFRYVKVDDEHFTVNANPIKPGNTGSQYIFSDETGVLRHDRIKPATAESEPLN